MLKHASIRPRWGKKTASLFCVPPKKSFVSRVRQRVASTGKVRVGGKCAEVSAESPATQGMGTRNTLYEYIFDYVFWALDQTSRSKMFNF